MTQLTGLHGADLFWSVEDELLPSNGRRGWVDGMVASVHAETDVPSLLEQWADALGLAPVEAAHGGTVAYAGEVGGMRVRVWGIVDRAAWDASPAGVS